eukprot:4963747-Amphidinium_carterae.1
MVTILHVIRSATRYQNKEEDLLCAFMEGWVRTAGAPKQLLCECTVVPTFEGASSGSIVVEHHNGLLREPLHRCEGRMLAVHVKNALTVIGRHTPYEAVDLNHDNGVNADCKYIYRPTGYSSFLRTVAVCQNTSELPAALQTDRSNRSISAHSKQACNSMIHTIASSTAVKIAFPTTSDACAARCDRSWWYRRLCALIPCC